MRTIPLDSGRAVGARHRGIHEPERRRLQRTPVAIAVKQCVGPDLFLCQAGNISVGGMLLARVYERLYGRLPSCRLEFGLPNAEDVLSVRGDVVREQRSGSYHLMAVRFSAVRLAHLDIIRSYANSRPPKPARQAFEI